MLISSVDTVVAASDVLKKLLVTKTGISFYKGYKEQVQDYLFHYLHPFKTGKSKVKVPPFSLVRKGG